MLGGDMRVCDGGWKAWVQFAGESRVVGGNYGVGAVKGAVYVDVNSWVLGALEPHLHNNPVGVAVGVCGRYGGYPLWGREEMSSRHTFRVGEYLVGLSLGQGDGGGVTGGILRGGEGSCV